MPHLLEAQRRGQRIKTLENRPTLPAHLVVVAQARSDIGAESDLASVAEWFRAAGLDPSPERFFWLLDRLRAIEAAHDEHRGTD